MVMTDCGHTDFVEADPKSLGPPFPYAFELALGLSHQGSPLRLLSVTASSM